MNLPCLVRTGYLNEMKFKQIFLLKNEFLIRYKNYPVQAGRDVFHNRGFAHTNEELPLFRTIFSMQLHQPGKAGQSVYLENVH